jgi:DNA-binding LytR/AlgR family response regulator
MDSQDNIIPNIFFSPELEHFYQINYYLNKKIRQVVNNKLDQFIDDFKEELGLLLSISFGIFLFILFFQPFPFVGFDFNNSLLVIAGMGTIVFLIMVLIRITLPSILRRRINDSKTFILPSYFIGFIILVLSSVAFVFYLRYVGMVTITFFITVKVVLICFAPPLALGLSDLVDDLKQQNEMLIVEKKIIQKQVERYEEDILNKTIEFISENSSENFSLLIAEVAFIKSADNYVEIVYKEGVTYKKKLIRNTLRNVELQIKQYSNFLRCHRICIVNLHYIEKLFNSDGNHWLTIKGYDEQVPVSRQYLLKLKEAL